jgi:hypothetical protein
VVCSPTSTRLARLGKSTGKGGSEMQLSTPTHVLVSPQKAGWIPDEFAKACSRCQVSENLWAARRGSAPTLTWLCSQAAFSVG